MNKKAELYFKALGLYIILAILVLVLVSGDGLGAGTMAYWGILFASIESRELK